MGAEQKYLRNLLLLSTCFFLVFTAFSTIQNLEASIVNGHCSDCTHYCDNSDPHGACYDAAHSPSDVSKKTVTCSYIDGNGAKYCAVMGGDCHNACPNTDGGETVIGAALPVNAQFDTCKASTNVGSVAMGLLYATFTLCCLFGPYIVDWLGAKWSVVAGFVLFSVFCCANVLVAAFPTTLALQWGLLLPSSALVGLAASFLWTAQGSYVTENANCYAQACGMEDSKALGLFNGIFFGIFQFTQISGNLAASLLLNNAKWSTTSLFIFYLCFAGAGTVLAMFISGGPTRAPDNTVQNGDDKASVASSTHSASLNGKAYVVEKKSFAASVRGMVELWKDRRMQLLIPLIMYSGVEMGFIWGDFTSNWVKPSVGTQNIGYVMAAFGGVDVLASVVLGKISDITGRMPVITLGFCAQIGVLITLHQISVGDCDHKWGLLIACAGAWGIGDAVWNTQISAILGEVFQKRKEDAFSNFKLWQSFMISVMFFLNLDDSLMTKNATMYFMGVFLIVSYLSYMAELCVKSQKHEVEPLLKEEA